MKKILVAILTLCTASIASAASFEERVERLITPVKLYVHASTEYEKVDKFPNIILVDEYTIRSLIQCKTDICKHSTTVFNHHTNAIYMNRDKMKNLNSIHLMGMMIHEYVHFLQFHNGKRATTCEKRGNLEAEAILIQRVFLYRRGLSNPVKQINFVCDGVLTVYAKE